MDLETSDQIVVVLPETDDVVGPMNYAQLQEFGLAEAEAAFFATEEEEAFRPQGWNAEMAWTNLIGEGYQIRILTPFVSAAS
jgi:hypothetical protein